MLKVGKKALITTDQWFFAPNGEQYKAVYGTIKGVYDSQLTLGVKTNANELVCGYRQYDFGWLSNSLCD